MAPAPTPPVTIREAVIARLNSIWSGDPVSQFPMRVANLSTIVPQIYWDDASQATTYPCLLCTVTSRDRTHNLAGASGQSTAEFTMTAMHQGTHAQAICTSIVNQVKASFDGFNGIQSGILFERTFIIDEADSSVAPPDGSDNWIYVVTVTYEIVHSEPQPTSVTQTDV
jgi:hypothetical protein